MPGNIVNLSAADIAKWPPANYANPETRDWMPIYAGALYAVTTFMSGTRLWLRAYKKQAGGFGIDDTFLLAAWLCITWFLIVSIISTNVYQIDRHMWDVLPSMYENIAKMVWIAELAFLLTSCFVKLSVLLFYRRLVHGLYSKYWVWALIATMVFTVAYTLGFILALIFNCSPTDSYWRSFDMNYSQEYHCADTTINNILAGIFAAFSDLCAVAIPLAMTWNFTMPWPQKVALNIVFSLGFLVVGASIARTFYLYEVGHESDVTYYMFDAFIWSSLELNLAIMCASAPALRSLLRNLLSEPWSRYRERRANRRQQRRQASTTSDEALVGMQFYREPTAYQRTEPYNLHYASDKHKPSFDNASSEAGSRPSVWQNEELRLVRTASDAQDFDLHTLLPHASLGQGRVS